MKKLLLALLLVPSLAFGQGAVTFDGSTDYYDTTNFPSGFTDANWAQMCFQYSSDGATTATHASLSLNDSTAAVNSVGALIERFGSGNRLYLGYSVDDAGTFGIPTSTVTDPATWNYFSFVTTAGNSRAVRHGAWHQRTWSSATNTTSFASSFSANFDTVTVGRNSVSTPASYWVGDISWCALWDDSSTIATNGQLYRMLAGESPDVATANFGASLKGYWRFWTTGTQQDYSGNGRTLSENGTPTTTSDVAGTTYWPRGGN